MELVKQSDLVVLLADLPQQGVRRGDVGTVTEVFETNEHHPGGYLVGVLGGYTTFSSFSLETLNLLRDGAWLQALVYPAASVILGLIAVWGGALLARVI